MEKFKENLLRFFLIYIKSVDEKVVNRYYRLKEFKEKPEKVWFLQVKLHYKGHYGRAYNGLTNELPLGYKDKKGYQTARDYYKDVLIWWMCKKSDSFMMEYESGECQIFREDFESISFVNEIRDKSRT